jgi:hypothetical protein
VRNAASGISGWLAACPTDYLKMGALPSQNTYFTPFVSPLIRVTRVFLGYRTSWGLTINSCFALHEKGVLRNVYESNQVFDHIACCFCSGNSSIWARKEME